MNEEETWEKCDKDCILIASIDKQKVPTESSGFMHAPKYWYHEENAK